MNFRSLRYALFVGVVAILLVPIAVVASPGFDDVPPSNNFYNDIEWLADAGVTKGCNPAQGNTNFCPKSYVTREQMAAFMHRLADSGVVDAGTLGGLAPHEFEGAVGPQGPAGVQGPAGPQGPPGVLNFYTVDAYITASTSGYYPGDAMCQPGDIASGGGVQLQANSPDFVLITSAPTASGGNPTVPGGWTPTGWHGEVWLGIDLGGGFWTYNVWAVCADMTP